MTTRSAGEQRAAERGATPAAVTRPVRPRPKPALAEAAAVIQRLAVLLAAGLAPASAWAHVADSTGSKLAARVAAGEPIEDASRHTPALERSAWRGLAAAWAVASEAGAPLAPSLREYASSLRALAQIERDTRVALAGPRATARTVMALPAVGLLFGLALGFDTLTTLVTTPPGWVCLAVGGALIGVAFRWNRRLLRSAQPTSATPGLGCELVAIAMTGGVSLDRARAIVSAASSRYGIADADGVDQVLELSRRAGVPAAELLRSEADEQRASARAAAQELAAKLSVRLLLPLGLCILPAFLVLGVAPMMLAVIGSTVGVLG